jgi:hypothetical protein
MNVKRRNKGKNVLFVNKKNHKNFDRLARPSLAGLVSAALTARERGREAPRGQSFFGSFCSQKEHFSRLFHIKGILHLLKGRNMKRSNILLSTAMALALAAPGVALAQMVDPAPAAVDIAGVKTTYVRLANGIPAVLYEPTSLGPKSQIGLFVMHPSGDYLTFSACGELSKRGYRVLCANYSSSKTGAFDDGVLDSMLLVTKRGVNYLHSVPGVKKVVLFGHSGGATIMTAYQDIALNGVAICQDADKIHKCPDTLAGLPAADGVVLADANWGQAEMVLLSVDPAIESETSGMKLNPDLDMFNPKNGMTPQGAHFTKEFIQKFQTAEGKRNNALVAAAEARLALIEAGKGNFTDDEPFIIPGAFVAANKLFSADTSLLAHTQKPWPLLKGDGTVVNGIVYSVRVPESRANPAPQYGWGALKTTVKGFLSSYAIRVNSDFGYDADSIHGVDWTSTYASPPGNAEGITTPLLALGMTGHWEGLAAETIYDHANKAQDKTLAFVEGGTHMYTPCVKCEKTPGQFGDTIKTTYDYIDGWLSKSGRFF